VRLARSVAGALALLLAGAADRSASAQIVPGSAAPNATPNAAPAPGRSDAPAGIIGEGRSHRLRRSDDPPPSNPVDLRPQPDPTRDDGAPDGTAFGMEPERAAAGRSQLTLTPPPDRFAPPPLRSRPPPEGDAK
jgi:hypothetical protein